MYRQGLVDSKVCRCYSKENDEDTLYTLFCSNEYYSTYRTRLISNLQVQVILLADSDIFPLCILENVLNKECMLLDEVLSKINLELK